MSAADVATACASLGRIGPPAAAAAADADASSTLQALVSRHQGSMSLRQLSDSLWGLGKAGLAVEGSWVGGLWRDMMHRSRQVRGIWAILYVWSIRLAPKSTLLQKSIQSPDI
jgi:hypothetical protein